MIAVLPVLRIVFNPIGKVAKLEVWLETTLVDVGQISPLKQIVAVAMHKTQSAA